MNNNINVNATHTAAVRLGKVLTASTGGLQGLDSGLRG